MELMSNDGKPHDDWSSSFGTARQLRIMLQSMKMGSDMCFEGYRDGGIGSMAMARGEMGAVIGITCQQHSRTALFPHLHLVGHKRFCAERAVLGFF